MSSAGFEFDVAVIGSGAGGSVLAAACARSGLRVLLVERGRGQDLQSEVSDGKVFHDEHRTLIQRHPYDDRAVYLGDEPSRLYMGAGPGGSTSVFGGAMLRPAPHDFHPGRCYADRLPPELHDWPVSYAELEPFYEQAEQLFALASPEGNHAAPLYPSSYDRNRPPLPLAKINRRVVRRAEEAGLHPFQLPLSIQRDRCLRCAHCAGFPCPVDARRSSWHVVQEAIASGYALTVMQNCEAESLIRSPSGPVDALNLRNRSTGKESTIRARRYALAAGAVGSACLLLKSGFQSSHIGRNYMLHYNPIAVGILPHRTEGDQTFIKQLGFTDWYLGTEDCPEKMGLVQSLPVPGPLMLRKNGLRHVPDFLLQSLRRRMLPMAGIVEDLPNPKNRVTLGSGGRIELHHQYSKYDTQRADSLRKTMKRLLRSCGAWLTPARDIPSREHVAHQCGTLRSGKDARHAVCSPECRVFEQPDVFVADGSWMPTSTGVGPSLTIAANALRVAQIIRAEV